MKVETAKEARLLFLIRLGLNKSDKELEEVFDLYKEQQITELKEKNLDDNNGWELDYQKTIKQAEQIKELKEVINILSGEQTILNEIRRETFPTVELYDAYAQALKKDNNSFDEHNGTTCFD